MINIIKKLFKYKIIFYPPLRSDIVIYSSFNLEFILNIIERQKNTLINFSEINFCILIISFFKLRFSKIGYINSYIEYCSPKVIITSQDDDINFFNLKHYHKNIKTVAIQYGIRTMATWKLFERMKGNKIEKELDHLVCFSEFEKNKYDNYIKINNFHLLGSIINNGFTTKWEKNNDVIYISQLRLNYKNNPILFNLSGNDYFHNNFYQIDKDLLPLVDKFCKKNNLNLIILGAGKSTNEEEFFYDILGHNDFIFKDKKGLSSYEIISKSRFIISIDSTLGMESFARKIPTVFFPARYKYINEMSWRSGCETSKVSRNIWSEDIDKINVDQILGYISEISYKDFSNLWDNNYQKMMSYDKNNNSLKKLINSLIK